MTMNNIMVKALSQVSVLACNNSVRRDMAAIFPTNVERCCKTDVSYFAKIAERHTQSHTAPKVKAIA